MPYGPAYVVDGPRPSAPRYTLITAADVETVEDDHWLNGVQVRPYPCDLPATWATCQGTAVHAAKVTGTGIVIGNFDVLTVYLAETCTSRGIVTDQDFRNRATVAFTAREAWAVEREFWNGSELPQNPHLSGAGATLLNGNTVTGLVDGLARLEDAIASSGQAGMIHATPGLVSAWSSNYQVFKEGNQLVTQLGTIVVPGFGYPGTAPAGGTAASGAESWAVATGRVQVLRSNAFVVPDTLAAALDKGTNTVTYRVERYYVASWDGCFRAAIRVDRCKPNC